MVVLSLSVLYLNDLLTTLESDQQNNLLGLWLQTHMDQHPLVSADVAVSR